VQKHFPDKVFRSIIPRSVRLAEAPSYGVPVSAYAPQSRGARAYAALARELLEGDGLTVPSLGDPNADTSAADAFQGE